MMITVLTMNITEFSATAMLHGITIGALSNEDSDAKSPGIKRHLANCTNSFVQFAIHCQETGF